MPDKKQAYHNLRGAGMDPTTARILLGATVEESALWELRGPRTPLGDLLDENFREMFGRRPDAP